MLWTYLADDLTEHAWQAVLIKKCYMTTARVNAD